MPANQLREEEVNLLFPGQSVTSTQTDQLQSIIKGFDPDMKPYLYFKNSEGVLFYFIVLHKCNVVSMRSNIAQYRIQHSKDKYRK